MTIILASVSNQGHVASSDGRTISAGNIVSKNTNKTFSLYNGKIRGSYAGMMPFGNYTCYGAKEPRDYINDISKKICPHSIEEFAEVLKNELLVIIQNLSVNEWPVKDRKLCIFLTGGKSLNNEDYVIYEIYFRPNDRDTDVIATIDGPQGPDNNKVLNRCHSSSGEALNAALCFLDAHESNSDLAIEEMIKLHDQALTVAIDEAEKNNKGTNSSCGGSHYFQPDNVLRSNIT